MTSTTFRAIVGIAAIALAVPAATSASASPCHDGREHVSTGPNSSQDPYLRPIAPGVHNTSILTVGDKANNGYQMVGLPDGLGAYDNGDGTITLLMNHEYGADKGAVRAHGAKGSYVSEWVIEKKTLKVRKGSDLVRKLILTDPKFGLAMSRLCSADLPDKTAFYNAWTGKGYDGRIFMNGEEDPTTGRAFAHVATGKEAHTSYEFAAMGKSQWENVLAHPNMGDRTFVMGTDDSTPGQVYFYSGVKKKTGTALEKAGLTGGQLYGIRVKSGMHEFDKATGNGTVGFPLKDRFELAPLGDGSKFATVDEMDAKSDELNITRWWRPEDGAWATNNANVFYFNTTAKFGGPTRTWKLTFDCIEHPERGGKVEAIVNGEDAQMLDNMAVSNSGRQIVLNEDPGNQDYLARVHSYDVRKDTLTPVLQHDPNRFAKGGSKFLTTDEESSGTIDVSKYFGPNTYMLTTQAHYALPGDLVEGGQLQLARIPMNSGKGKH